MKIKYTVLSHEKFKKYKLGLMCGEARSNYPMIE